jgi:hypothetical protein
MSWKYDIYKDECYMLMIHDGDVVIDTISDKERNEIELLFRNANLPCVEDVEGVFELFENEEDLETIIPILAQAGWKAEKLRDKWQPRSIFVKQSWRDLAAQAKPKPPEPQIINDRESCVAVSYKCNSCGQQTRSGETVRTITVLLNPREDSYAKFHYCDACKDKVDTEKLLKEPIKKVVSPEDQRLIDLLEGKVTSEPEKPKAKVAKKPEPVKQSKGKPGEAYCRENLAELCQEVLGWDNTGILCDGKLRILVTQLSTHADLHAAERMVTRMALKKVAGN